MYPAGQHPLFPYTEEDRRVVLENAGIRETQLNNDINAIKTWIQKQPHLAEAGIDSHAVTFYLVMAKGSVEKAKQRIDNFYKMRATAHEIHDRVTLLKDQYRPVYHTHILPSAPKLFKGSRVSFVKVFDWQKFKIEDAVLNVAMLIDIRYSNDLTSGETWVFDLENATLAQIIKLNLLALSRAYGIFHNGLGLKIVAIHIVNCSLTSVIEAILNLCKSFLSNKILGRMKFYDTPEELHKVLPKECLPEDYGGYLPSFEVYKDKMEKLITDEKTKEFLLDACQMVSDESKRPKTTYDEDYLPGNFKHLQLD